ncbi:MAG TPA: fibronectin type III domain-containing protein [Casimicrobiaceae bacterium]|nr:fibronectin type III domain-containing protein [Casimicrobiaceae bacterium]
MDDLRFCELSGTISHVSVVAAVSAQKNPRAAARPTRSLFASWTAAVPGDSPTDSYQITINGSDGGGTFTQAVPGSTLTATFAVSDIPDWSVKVRAHNAAGWGPWSARFVLGGD